MYLLLAPIPRTRVLRPLAAHQLRTAVTGGAVAGVALGIASAARLPRGAGEWALAGLLAGACIAAVLWGAVAVASARRLTPSAANVAGLCLVALAGVDAAFHTWIAPSTWIGSVALLPLPNLVPAVVVVAALVIAVAVPAIALVVIAGTSLEPLAHRSALTSQMRFAASMQDMRTVVLLHRQLSMEQSRRRPWLRLPAHRKVRRPAWRRGWHGYLRWPLDRVVRVLVLLAGAAALAYAAPATHLLIIGGGAALFVAGLDVVEPFAAELDHPTLLLTYGVSIRAVLLRNLAAPVAAMVGLALVAAGALTVVAGGHPVLVFACAVSAALAALAGSTLNVVLGPPAASQMVGLSLLPEVYGIVLLVRQGLPPAVAVAGLAPVVVAGAHGDLAGVVVAAGVSAIAACSLLYSALRGL